jgi:hypothetical protein
MSLDPFFSCAHRALSRAWERRCHSGNGPSFRSPNHLHSFHSAADLGTALTYKSSRRSSRQPFRSWPQRTLHSRRAVLRSAMEDTKDLHSTESPSYKTCSRLGSSLDRDTRSRRIGALRSIGRRLRTVHLQARSSSQHRRRFLGTTHRARSNRTRSPIDHSRAARLRRTYRALRTSRSLRARRNHHTRTLPRSCGWCHCIDLPPSRHDLRRTWRRPMARGDILFVRRTMRSSADLRTSRNPGRQGTGHR